MRFKRIGKRLISLVLALAILIPITIQALASVAFAVSGDMDTTHQGMGSGTGETYWNTSDYGARLTAVDANTGAVVSNSIDWTNCNPGSGTIIHFGKVSKSAYRKNPNITPNVTVYDCKKPPAGFPVMIGGDVDAIRNYFIDETAIKDFADSVSPGDSQALADKILSGEYDVIIEPIAYFTWNGVRYAMTATEAALYDIAVSGALKSSWIAPVTHANLPDGLYVDGNYPKLGYTGGKPKYSSYGSSGIGYYNDNQIVNCSLGVGIIYCKEPPTKELKMVHHIYNLNISLPKGVTFPLGSSGEFVLNEENCRNLLTGKQVTLTDGSHRMPNNNSVAEFMKALAEGTLAGVKTTGKWDTPISYTVEDKNKWNGFSSKSGTYNGYPYTETYKFSDDKNYAGKLNVRYPDSLCVAMSAETAAVDISGNAYLGPESGHFENGACPVLIQRIGGDQQLGQDFMITSGKATTSARTLSSDTTGKVISTLALMCLSTIAGSETSGSNGVASTIATTELAAISKNGSALHTATYAITFSDLPTDIYHHQTTVNITLDDGDSQPTDLNSLKTFVKNNPDKVGITWKEPVVHTTTTDKTYSPKDDPKLKNISNTLSSGFIVGIEGYKPDTGTEEPQADPGHNPYPTVDPVADRKENPAFDPDNPDTWNPINKTVTIPLSAKEIDEVHTAVIKVDFHGSTKPTVKNDRIKTYDVSQFIDQTVPAIDDSVHIKALADGVNADRESAYNNSVMSSHTHSGDKLRQAVLQSYVLSFSDNDRVEANNYTDQLGDEVEARADAYDQRKGSHSSSCYTHDEDGTSHLNCSSHHHYSTRCSTSHGAIHKYDCHYTKESVEVGFGLNVSQVTHYEDTTGHAILKAKSDYKSIGALTGNGSFTEVGFTIPKDYYVHQNVVKWGTNGSNNEYTYLPAKSGSTNEFTTFDVLLDQSKKAYRLKYYNDIEEVEYQSKTQTSEDKKQDVRNASADMKFDYLSGDDNGIKIDGAKFLSHRDLLSGDDVTTSLAVAGYMAKYAHNSNTNAYLYFMKTSGFEFEGVDKNSLVNRDTDSNLSFSSATNQIGHENRTIWVSNAAKLDQLESSPYGTGNTFNTDYAGGPAELGLTTNTHVRFGLGGRANKVGVNLYSNFIANSFEIDDASLNKATEEGDALRSIWYTTNESQGAEFTACHGLYDSPGHGNLTCGGQCCSSTHSPHNCPYKPETYHATKNVHKDWTSVSNNKYVLKDTGNNYLTNGHYNSRVIFDGKTQSDMFTEIYTSRITFHIPLGVEGTTAGSFDDLKYKATNAKGKLVDNAELKLDENNNLTVQYTDSEQDEWKKNTARKNNNYQKLGESHDKGNMLSRYTFTTPTGDYTFNPAYYMQYDDKLEDVNKAVWMLSHQPRKINFRDTLAVELDYGDGSHSRSGSGGTSAGAGPGEDGVYCTHVTTAWSTDNADTKVHEHTKLPVAKAGNSYQTTTDAISGSVEAYVVLQDPDFAENPNEVKAANEKKMQEYSAQMEGIRQQFQALAAPDSTRIPTEDNPVVDKDSLSLAMYSNMVNASSMNSAFRITDTQSEVPMLDDKEPMIFSKDTNVDAKVSTASSSGTGGSGSDISNPVTNKSWTYYALKGYEVKPFDNGKDSQLATGFGDLNMDISDTVGERKIKLGSDSFKIEKMPNGVVFNELNNHLCTVMVEPWDTDSKSLSSPAGSLPFLDEESGTPSSGSFNWYSEDYEGFIVAKFEIDFTISGKGNTAAQDKDGYSSGTHSNPSGNAFGTEFRSIYRAESDWRSDVNHLAAQPDHDLHVYKPDTWKNITGSNNKIGDFYLDPDKSTDKTTAVLADWASSSDIKDLSIGNVKVHYAKGIYGIGVELANLNFTFGDKSGGEEPIEGKPVSFYYQPTYFNIRGSVFDTAR